MNKDFWERIDRLEELADRANPLKWQNNFDGIMCSRECSHKILAHKKMHLICTAARNELVFFTYLVAIPRQRFSDKNAFSTKWRNLYKYLS